MSGFKKEDDDEFAGLPEEEEEDVDGTLPLLITHSLFDYFLNYI